MERVLRVVPGLFMLFSMVFAALLSGCGGGGGGSSGFGGDPVAITKVNAPHVAAVTVSLGGDVGGAGLQSGGTVTASNAGPNAHALSAATAALEQVDHRSGELGLRQVQSTSIAPASSSTLDCIYSGTYTIVSKSSTSASITFSNCVDTPGETINGKITLSSISVTGDPNFPPWSVSGRLGFSNYSSDAGTGYTLNGSGNFAMGFDGIVDDLSITDATFTDSVGGQSNTLSGFSFSMAVNTSDLSYTQSMNGSLNSGLLVGSVTFQTQMPFAGISVDNGDPESGVFKVIGANNSSVTLTAIGAGNVTLKVDADGDGQVDADGTSSTTWSDLYSLL